ncbi:Dehydrodolichyl diphosphate synthase 5 [Raphanus sativus]|nr:Dehydrodolichyl diphosphate synthase 5 [Raphanus sativus]
MLLLVSIIFTFLVLIIILCLFISRRLSVPLSFTTIRRFIKVAASQGDEEEKRDQKCGTYGRKEKQERIPKHVAVILDGNRRWAKKQGRRTAEGHEAGARRVVELAKEFFSLGINTVSLFAFSTENWGRPEDEVNYLMSMFEKILKTEALYANVPLFFRFKVRISFIGNRTGLP